MAQLLENNASAQESRGPGKFLSGMVVLIFILVVACFVVLLTKSNDNSTTSTETKPKNLIFLVSDGMGLSTVRVLEDYLASLPAYEKQSTALLDHMLGVMETQSGNSLVTATAFATGQRSYNSAIGVDEAGNPIGSIMEAAIDKGVAAGCVVTSRITHATPAGFTAHAIHRDYENEVAYQQGHLGLDVMFGGGRRHFIGQNGDTETYGSSKRSDDFDIFADKDKYGIKKTITKKSELKSLGTADSPVWGLFASSHMNYEVDRDTSGEEPSLTDMVEKALEILAHKGDESGKGFFLMIEGSRIDHGQHRNDIAAAIKDADIFDDAFKMAVDFSKSRGDDTLVISISDHETGGLSVGRGINVKRGQSTTGILGGTEPATDDLASDKGSFSENTNIYPLDHATENVHPYRYHPNLIAGLKASNQAIMSDVMGFTPTADKTRAAYAYETFEAKTGIQLKQVEKDFLSAAITEFEAIKANVETPADDFYDSQMLGWAFNEILSERLYIGWTTKEHTGVDIGVFGYGPGVDKFRGAVKNTDIPNRLADLFGWNQSAVTSRLRASYVAGDLDIWDEDKGLAPKAWENGRPLPEGNLRGAQQ